MQIVFVLLAVGALAAAADFGIVALVRKIWKKNSGNCGRTALILLLSGVALILAFLAEGGIETVLLILALLLVLTGIIFGILWLIFKISGHPRKWTGWLAAICPGSGIVIFLLSSKMEISSALQIVGLLLVPVALILLIINIIGAIRKRAKLRNWLVMSGVAAVAITLFCISDAVWKSQLSRAEKEHELNEITVQIDYDFEVVDGAEPVEIVSSRGFENETLYRTTYRMVYDSQDADLLLDETDVTAEMCIAAIKNNEEIDGEYQAYFIDFVQRIDRLYPDSDLSILYQNLPSLSVDVLDSMGYMMKSMSTTSLGCYVMSENAIYIPEGTKYTEGEFGFQVLIHEFCHAARTSWFDEDDFHCRVTFCSDSDNKLLEECMNSVFSCSLLNYYEWDIAYQVPSNYLRIMLECMENYTLSDYMNHSDMYFLSKLDEASGYTNYAQVIWKLITLQRSDWEDDMVDIPAEEYEPIYAFLCELYYDKYITPDMTPEECTEVADELVYKAFYDAPEGYKINQQYFYDYLRSYSNSNT